MPNYRSIKIALHSQFDVETLPEYYPAPKATYIARGITGLIPELTSDDTSTCSVYIPVLPGSTFWIGYSIAPPVPDGHYFLFKLYINGTHIMNWSTGKKENWKGKTMFGLFERWDDEEGKMRAEKRVLCFTPSDKKDKMRKDVMDMFDEKARIEIKVLRAHGRKRVEREMEEYRRTQHAKYGKGVSLINAGRSGPDQPKRFYKFALIDPVDQPFATFRYYYRTWDQLRDLGLLGEEWNRAGEENDLSVIEPNEPVDREVEEDSRRDVSSRESITPGQGPNDGAADEESTGDDDGDSRKVDDKKYSSRPSSERFSNSGKLSRPTTPGVALYTARDTLPQPNTYIPRGAPKSNLGISDERLDEQAQQRLSYVSTPPQFYRFSVPSPVKLDPPEPGSRPLPTIPRESDSSSCTPNHPYPEYLVSDCTVRASSPVKLARENVFTPPLKTKKDDGRTASSLMNAISSTWRRRGAQSPASNGTSSRDGARSVP